MLFIQHPIFIFCFGPKKPYDTLLFLFCLWIHLRAYDNELKISNDIKFYLLNNLTLNVLKNNHQMLKYLCQVHQVLQVIWKYHILKHFLFLPFQRKKLIFLLKFNLMRQVSWIFCRLGLMHNKKLVQNIQVELK